MLILPQSYNPATSILYKFNNNLLSKNYLLPPETNISSLKKKNAEYSTKKKKEKTNDEGISDSTESHPRGKTFPTIKRPKIVSTLSKVSNRC